MALTLRGKTTQKPAVQAPPAPEAIDYRAAVSADRFADLVTAVCAEHEAAALQERSRVDARLELERQAQHVRTLQCRRDGINSATDALWRTHQDYIDRFQQQIEAIDQRLANVRAQRDQRLAEGPALLQQFGADVVRLVEHLADARTLWAAANSRVESILELLSDASPIVERHGHRTGGAERILVPKLPSGTTLLSVVADLKEFVGPDRTHVRSRTTVALETLRKFGVTERV